MSTEEWILILTAFVVATNVALVIIGIYALVYGIRTYKITLGEIDNKRNQSGSD